MIQLIKKSDEAMGTDEGVFYFQPTHIGCSIVVTGDLGTDTIPVTYLDDDDNETDAYDSEGEALELSATNPMIPIYSAVKVKCTKGETTNEVGVNIHGIS